MESALEIPSIGAMPEPDTPQPPPPPPQLSAPKAPTAPPTPPSALALARPQAPPPVPEFAPPPPQLPPVGQAPKKPTPTTMRLASIVLTPDSTEISADARQAIDRAVAAYREQPGKIRVAVYAPIGAQPGQAAAIDSALRRAQIIAEALKAAGVPQDKVQTEALPANANSPAGRADVLIER
jgi:outer membrane protein OmpA-like peptidoglycan-associated protein